MHMKLTIERTQPEQDEFERWWSDYRMRRSTAVEPYNLEWLTAKAAWNAARRPAAKNEPEYRPITDWPSCVWLINSKGQVVFKGASYPVVISSSVFSTDFDAPYVGGLYRLLQPGERIVISND